MSVTLEITPRKLVSVWSFLTLEERQQLLESSPLVAPITSSLTWMRRYTRTWDEQDQANPNKPFPDWSYFDLLHHYWETEETLFLEKSRTVMATWWAVAECFHYVMVNHPASCIFWCPDQDRAEKCIEYSKMLWAQMDPVLKELYPLPRKKKRVEDQSVFRFELASGSWLEALPGKNPDKIRSEHPTIVCMDEVAFNSAASQAYNNAVAARPKKLIAFSSAKPGWFFDTIRCAVPEEIKELA